MNHLSRGHDGLHVDRRTSRGGARAGWATAAFLALACGCGTSTPGQSSDSGGTGGTGGSTTGAGGSPASSASSSMTTSASSSSGGAGCSLDGAKPTPIRRKVLLVIYNPVIASKGNVPLTQAMGWHDPEALITAFVDWWRETSDCRVEFTIADKIVLDSFPKKIDGFAYEEASYLDVAAKIKDPHSPDDLDYLPVLSDYDVCGRVNAGEIDELWLFGGPWFGIYESRLTGPRAFEYNGPPLTGTTCNRLVPIMGFSYERGLGEMIHDIGHRTEATLTRVYGGWEENRIDHNWDRFGLVASQSPDFEFSGCGSIHYAPTSVDKYVYDDPTPVLSTCADFLNYPAIAAEPEKGLAPVSCHDWGCSDVGYYRWWFEHLPRAAGADEHGRLNDWWRYAMDPQTYLDAPPSNAPCADYLGASLCDAASPRCAWYGCLNRCLPGPVNPAACGCLGAPDVPSCNATSGCAWYACASLCFPTGTPNEIACGG